MTEKSFDRDRSYVGILDRITIGEGKRREKRKRGFGIRVESEEREKREKRELVRERDKIKREER